jgi:hypothetical protein
MNRASTDRASLRKLAEQLMKENHPIGPELLDYADAWDKEVAKRIEMTNSPHTPRELLDAARTVCNLLRDEQWDMRASTFANAYAALQKAITDTFHSETGAKSPYDFEVGGPPTTADDSRGEEERNDRLTPSAIGTVGDETAWVLAQVYATSNSSLPRAHLIKVLEDRLREVAPTHPLIASRECEGGEG